MERCRTQIRRGSRGEAIGLDLNPMLMIAREEAGDFDGMSYLVTQTEAGAAAGMRWTVKQKATQP